MSKPRPKYVTNRHLACHNHSSLDTPTENSGITINKMVMLGKAKNTEKLITRILYFNINFEYHYLKPISSLKVKPNLVSLLFGLG